MQPLLYQPKRKATIFEETLFRIHRSATYGAGLAFCGFFGYLICGYIALIRGVFSPVYRFASMRDPVFLAISLAIGLFLAVSTGSLVSLALLTEGDSVNNGFVTVIGMAGFGLSLAVIRISMGVLI